MRLSEHRYRTVSRITGQLLFVEKVMAARIGETVTVVAPDASLLAGEVLEIQEGLAVIQLYGESRGLDRENTVIIFSDAVRKAPLSPHIIGRCFDGSFRPLDGLPMYVAEKAAPIMGFAINPAARERPAGFIETSVSAIDGLNTLVKGQKLPIFSCAGLPAKELTARILKNARLRDAADKFAVVFVALGLTFQESSFYMDVLREIQTDFVAFINLADDPVMERLLAPRLALTAAEYLAFDLHMDVLVIITDMTNYCDALREISSAREELPGRRGYPGYMYSDLASLYERAGRIRSVEGSVTMIPLVTMPEDDITHPIADLTGYITEGQIVLSRLLHRQGISPPVDVLPSLSRLMQKGIGPGRTRGDHREVANLLYKYYARARELEKLEAVIGRDSMAEADHVLLDFGAAFGKEFIHQDAARRSIDTTLDIGLALLQRFGLSAVGDKP